MISIANAPVSYGIFELGDSSREGRPKAQKLLDMIHGAGYSGTDSGPIGLFGRGSDLRANLRERQLSLAGGWVELPFVDDLAFEAAIPRYLDALTFFSEAIPVNPELPPKPTLGCAGSEVRRENPGGGPEIGRAHV